MAYESRKEAEKVLQVTLGLNEYNYKDGEYIGFSVYEQRDHTRSWRSKPSGKYYVTMNALVRGDRDKMFKTKKGLNNEFDIAEIKAYIEKLIKARAEAKKAADTTAAIKAGNKPIAERVKAAYNGKRYISDWRSSHGGNSIVPSEGTEGIVRINWDFSLDEEKALRLMAFINELEGE